MNAPRIKTLSITSAMSLLTLAGCTGASMEGVNGSTTRADARERLERAQGQIAANAPALTNAKPTNRPANINVREGLFLGDTGYRATNGNPLPSRFETPDGISLSMAREVNIGDVAVAIERVTGIRVDYSDLNIVAGASEEAEGAAPAGIEASAGGQAQNDSNATTEASSLTLPPLERTFRINHHGKLSSLLDVVASRLDADWVYEAGRIQFLGPQTVTYTLWALPTTLQSDSSVGGGGGEVFGGASPASVSSSISFNYWETFETGMEALIPSGAASYNVNQGAGTIVVTAPRNIHRRVQKFVEGENRRLSRQVAVKLDVVAFTRTRADNKGTSLTALIDQSSNGFVLDYSTPVNEVENGGILDAGVLSGPLSGVSNLIQALSSAGEISVVNSSTVIAANNTPTPVSVTNERAYLSGSTTTVEDGEETTEIETSLVRSGMNAVVTPRIMSSGMVNLQYTLNLSDLVGLERFETDDGSMVVQLPNVTSRNFMQTLNIANGDSVVIGTFDQQSTNDDRQGPFDPEFWGLGGSSSYSMEDSQIFVVMTPVIMEAQNKPMRR